MKRTIMTQPVTSENDHDAFRKEKKRHSWLSGFRRRPESVDSALSSIVVKVTLSKLV